MPQDPHLIRADMRHQTIKRYYLKTGTLAEWQAISQNPTRFNQVWRRMLQIPDGDMPPPEAYRR